MYAFASGSMSSLFLITRHTSSSYLWWLVHISFSLSHIFVYFVELRAKHKMELENLTLTKQPLRTLHFFLLALLQYLKRLATYILSKSGLFVLLLVLVVAPGIFLVVSDGLHKKVWCISCYCFFNLWYTASHSITFDTVFYCNRVFTTKPKYSGKMILWRVVYSEIISFW